MDAIGGDETVTDLSCTRGFEELISPKRCAKSLILAAALFTLIGAPQSGFAQTINPGQTKIDVTYETPANARLASVMNELKSRRVLEQLSEFVVPMRLPHVFHLVARQCNVVNAFYSPEDWSLTICYELVDATIRGAPNADQLKSGLTREEVIVGEVVFGVLHELGHAAFDMLEVPVFGREEDAADQMAVFLSMQLSPQVERMVATGNYYFFTGLEAAGSGQTEWSSFADEHGTAGQRRYNGLCWAYGGDRELFKDYVEQGLLPQDRAQGCRDEYLRIRDAFNRTVLPFIDPKSVADVQKRNWFKP